jgi:hypothetical protein
MTNARQAWTKKASDVLLGRKIVAVQYLSNEERDEIGWYGCPIIMKLDDGTLIYPASDDEGNDAGALHYQKEGDNNFVIPVI